MYEKWRVRARAIITHEDKLLIVKNSRGNNYYALPGGHVDAGETPFTCIGRELFEELGVEATIVRLLYVYTFALKDGEQCLEFLFEVMNGEKFHTDEYTNASHAHELSEVKWIGKEDDVQLLPDRILQDFKNGELLSDEVRFVMDNSL